MVSYFRERFQNFIDSWLYKIIGANWHWCRYEFQHRGAIHVHCFAKIKNSELIHQKILDLKNSLSFPKLKLGLF